MLTADEVGYQLFMLYLVLIQTYVMKELPLLESKAQFRTKVVKKLSEENNFLNNAISNKKISSKSSTKKKESTSNTQKITKKKRKFLEETKQSYPKFAPTREKVKKWIQLIEYTLTMQQWLFSKEIPCSDIHHISNNNLAISSTS